MPSDILARIVETKKSELSYALAQVPLSSLKNRITGLPPARGFRRSMEGTEVALLAEIKRKSPSAGLIRPDLDPVAVACGYARGGAAALSVLTDETYFGGNAGILRQVRAAVDLPVLRKDFTIHPYHVYQARDMEADALLLIVAILEDCLLSDLLALTHELGMDAIVEVHTAEEMERALRVGSDCIGINNRDLRTFQTRLETTAELARLAPPDSLIAALSGISTREDVEEMARAGARAVLVGESLMRQPDVAEAARALCGVPIRSDLSRSAK